MITAPRQSFSYDKFLRSLVGLLLAPVAGGAIAMGGYALAVIARGFVFGGLPPDLLATLLLALGIGIQAGAQVGLAPAFVLGWPVHLVLLRTGFIHLPTYITFGAAIAAAAVQVMVMFVLNLGRYAPAAPIELSLVAACAGGIGATIFWLIRRPDHDDASSAR
jgi:hypothetical protein